MATGRRLSSFSIILIMVVLTIIGIAMMPLLSIQHTPTESPNSITVSYRWQNASARLVEQEVSSIIEGALARMDGISNTRSISRKGSGSVTVRFKKNIKMDVARFEVATIIRFIYPQLPEGVSFPSISLSSGGTSESVLMSYTVNSGMSTDRIGEYIENHLMPGLSRIEGVNRIDLNGINPFQYEITFDPEKAIIYGISAGDVAAAFRDHFKKEPVGFLTLEDGEASILLRLGNRADFDFSDIPIRVSGGRLVYLRDIGSVSYVESLPQTYYRINGLNTVNLTVYAEKGSNIIKLSGELRTLMGRLEKGFPEGMSLLLNYDASEYITGELNKIIIRTLMTVAILLLFVFVVSRKWNYLFVIAATMAANILIAVIFYCIFKVDIHIYSLAGITISLGIIIDTSIIMVDHYSYYGDRRAFTSILGATLTTIAALCVVFFLPEQQRLMLSDFAIVIFINLSVSLGISLLFIPAILDKLPMSKGVVKYSRRHVRRVLKFNKVYSSFIRFSRRWRWAFVVVLILAFGIPLHMLPDKITPKNKDEKPSGWAELYNKTIGGRFYQEHKRSFEKVLGGASGLFTSKISSAGFFREPQRPELIIRAGMPEGCTVQQLNDVVKRMENFLSNFQQIEMFRTNIQSHSNSSIEVTFKPEYENTGFPVVLKREVMSTAANYGGATWSVYGIDDNNFNNNVTSSFKSHRIILSGYNYDDLLFYAQKLADTLGINPRVSDPQVYAEVAWSVRQHEYSLDFFREWVSLAGININSYFGYMGQLLYSQPLTSIYKDGKVVDVVLSSSAKNTFDLWNVNYHPITVDQQEVKFSDLGVIEKKPTGLDIYKRNQTYELVVAFDFIGSYELANRLVTTEVDRLNDELPVGYKAREYTWGMNRKDKQKQVWLVLFIIVVIYFICCIIFESLLKPFVIILLIPISFIGVFLTFGLTDIKFDQGGFAAFVFLSGLVVNAGIYIINEYNITSAKGAGPLRSYIKAYNRKIVPIILTVISTVLGLIPFLYKGKDDVFWYAFATGTMGGLIFSLLVVIFILPLFMPFKANKRFKN